jgi:omega-hydroxy-beta-dihydromenaquinone-9 sulfotransferase
VNVHKPIIIVCAGRSGSTMLYRLLGRHKDVGWLSTYNQKLPSHLWVSVLSRLYGRKGLDPIRNHYAFPKPFSAYHFWQRYLPGIDRHDRPLTAADVPQSAIEPLRRDIASVLRYQNKTRFLTKVTGWARMAYFDRIFPDAVFLYLRRDPVSIVDSWIRAGWLNVTADIDSPDWEWGKVPDAYRHVWRQLGGGPLLSAAIKIQLDVDDIRRNVAQFPTRSHEVIYEDLVSDPRRSLRDILGFCDLEWTDAFERLITPSEVRNYSNRWKQERSAEDGKLLREFFARVNASTLAYKPAV